MKRVGHSASIQKRILWITLSCMLSMCTLISFFSYYLFKNYLQHSMIRATETNLQLLSDSINRSMDDVYQMVRFCQTSSHVSTYIESSPEPDSVLSVATVERINEEYSNNPSNNYIPRLAVITNDNFLQIVSTTYSSTADLTSLVPQLSFFETLLYDSSYNFSPGLIADPFHRKGRTVLPIIRPITYQYNSIQGGYLFMEVSVDLFTTPLARYHIAEDSCLILTLDGHNYLFEDGVFTELTTEYEFLEDMSHTAVRSATRITGIRDSEHSTQIMVSSPLNMANCYISQRISSVESFNQQRLFWLLLVGVLVGILVIGIMLVLLLNRMIHIPVLRIRDKMQRVSQGDFSRDASIEWNHELGDIGRGINDLSENVYLLMNKRLEDEKQKKDLEYQMLQSQINPHFIYNTLNSIKWMATIQGADGISEMTTALSRLLKSISKGTSLLVNIREELALIENYFTIQSYRYGGTISLDIQVAEDSIYDCQIIKFTLQPLVENAIFHGIEPKGCAGTVTIRAVYENVHADGTADICIDVTDDGVGMSREKAADILAGSAEASTDFFREIGISNVHSRLQYQFGPQYGITIESVESQYTTMSIHIPARRGDEA